MTPSDKTRIPGMMQIMGAVAKAANTKISTIMGSERRTGLIHARAAFYKLASEYGYGKREIMWYLDRDRTVGYNYESNLAGHLSQNSRFNALCADAADELREYTHRAERSPQRQISENLTAKPNDGNEMDRSQKLIEPEFKPWKGKLGWSFTAEEERRAWYACRAAEEFMRTYGQPRASIHPKPTNKKIPNEMTTADAAIYLDISPAFLTKGVKLGYLHRYKKPKDSSYWFQTAELDNFRIHIANKRGDKTK